MKAFTSRSFLITTFLIGAFLFNSVAAHASSATVSAGQQVTLSAAADGTAPFTYQWYKDGSILTGATGATYTINSFQSANAGTYTTVVSNAAGSTTSDNGVLTFSAVTVAPAFTTQPASQTVTAGGAVTFTAAASGTPTPTFQWKKGGVNISGATSTSYSIASTVTGDAGTYTVVATNSAGSVTSSSATLTVNVATSAPAFTTQPASQTVTAGGAVTFTAAASGTPTPTFQWKKGGVNISGATNASYSIASSVTGDAGTYTVVATNSAGSATSSSATLTVNVATSAPAFTTQPASQTVTAGSAVTFTAAASGAPVPTFQWKKGGVNISGATNASYSIASTVTGNAGSYTVVATNSVGSVTSNTATLTVNVATSAPVITTQPASQAVTTGNSVTFTVVASGTPTPTYQWKKGGTNISGAVNASYTRTNVTASSAGTYTVVVTNSAGSVTSSGAVLTVNSAPAFTTQPASQTVTAGGAVTLTAAASGTPAPTFQWKKSGVNISGATNAAYTIASTVTADAGSYTVVATNSVSAVTSNTATLTVNAANSAPVFTTQPASQSVTVGNSVTFSAAASGTPTPTYQWKKGGVNIAGATNATFTLSSAVAGDTASYTVVATNSVSAVTSNAATLTVNAAPAAPAFTTQPASQTVTVGGIVTFTAVASGTPTPTYQWKKAGVNISGATNATYTIASTVAGDAGFYTVVATNSVSAVTSNAAMLTVDAAPAAPAFTTQPASQTVTAGGSATFTVAASGTPTPTYQWKKGGVNISGATNATYTFANTVAGDAGSYTVVATNSVSAVTSNAATLTVNAAPAAPAFTTQPASQTVTVGGTVTFTAAASGTPTPTYQWKKGGVNISGATNASYTIASTVAGDAGSYTVVATNSVSAVTSSAATLTVNAATAAPAFTTQPASQSIPSGGSVTFSAVVIGTPTPTLQWKKGGANIAGATSASYTIASVAAVDANTYTVVATNSAGAVTSSGAVLTVTAVTVAPTITTQPASQSAITGAVVTFSVAASGSPSPTFQWRKNGINLSGATSSTYSIDGVAAANAGVYTVVATNSAGAVTSASATLTIDNNGIPVGFDVQGYLARYPEVKAMFGNDFRGAWLYYRDFGIYQGEIFDELFRVEEYLALYPELFALFDSDLSGALLHWLNTGSIEGRLGRIPLEFSAQGYFSRNADVATAVNSDPLLAWQHYWMYGIYEGRAYDEDLRVFEYLALNPDLQAAFLSDWRGAALHWMRYGKTEGRLGRIPTIFNSTSYIARYPDVAAAWGTEPTTVWQHYWLYGIDEGRVFDEVFRVDDYLALNPDLAAIFGTNRRGALMHWVRYGQSEGRVARYP